MLYPGCQLTMNSTTTLCQWNDSRPPLNQKLGGKSREDSCTQCEHNFFTHQTQSISDNPMQNLTAQHYIPLHSYPPCAVQIHPIFFFGEGEFPVFHLQILLNELSSVSPDLNKVKVIEDSLEAGTADTTLMIHLGCKQPLSLQDKLTLIIKLTTHIKTATYHIFYNIGGFRQGAQGACAPTPLFHWSCMQSIQRWIGPVSPSREDGLANNNWM